MRLAHRSAGVVGNLLAIWRLRRRCCQRRSSSKTMKGTLPPSSSASFFTGALWRHQDTVRLPWRPVKLMWRTVSRWRRTPCRRQCCWRRRSSLVQHAGRNAGAHGQLAGGGQGGQRRQPGGLMTTGQPSAGANLRVIIASGSSRGVMAAHTPWAGGSTSGGGCCQTLRRFRR